MPILKTHLLTYLNQGRGRAISWALWIVVTLTCSVGCDSDSDTQSMETSAGEATAGEATAGEVTAGEATAGEAIAGEATAGEAIAGEATAGEATAGEATAGEATAGEATAGEATAGEATAGEATAGEATAPELVSLSVRAIDPLSSSGVTGMSATLSAPSSGEGVMTTTDASGRATFEVSSGSPYEVVLSSEMHPPHHIVGDMGVMDVEQITFVSTYQLTSQVFQLLGMTPNPEAGTLVVGLDLPNLSPAVGASAELNVAYEQAFVFGAVRPELGQTVISGGGGFVSFANVTPGEVEITVTPPMGSSCKLFPAEQSDRASAQIYPGEVTVLAFTCRAE